MAARNRPGLSENTRLRIKTSMLVKRLEDHVHGDVEISATQLRAIEILLKKTLPDLTAQHNTEGDAKTLEDWLDELDSEAPKTQE